MFRRSTKLTALLVAATSVASMTPVMAVEKLNQRDGTVKNAVAYDNGKYAFYGYKDKDKDDTGIWYNAGSKSDKDKLVENLEEYEIKEKYGTKYAYVTEDGNKDEYLVDLSTGKIADEDTAEDKQASAKAKLISSLKKAERYNATSDSNYSLDDSTVASNRLFKDQFGDVWYQYVVATQGSVDHALKNTDDELKKKSQATTTAGVTAFGGDNAKAFTGFFNESGKYIDASYTANLKIYNPRKNKATIIEKFGHKYKDEALKADLVGVKPLAQDKDSLYVLSTVDVTYYPKLANGKYNCEDDAAGKLVVRQYFVQKISKAQGSKEDGAYVPKSVESFQVDHKDGIYKNNGDRNEAYDILASDSFNNTEKHATDDRPDTAASDKVLYAVKGDYIYVTFLKKHDKVQVYKFKLGKGKLDINNDAKTNGKSLLGMNSKANGDDIDTKIVVKDADADHTVPDDQDSKDAMEAVSLDVEGNTWIINQGKISMFDKDGFKDQYSTDRSYNRLDVYDKNSLIAWEDGKDSYTTVQEGKKQTVDDAQVVNPNLVDKSTITPAKTPGWEKQADGTWLLYDVTGNKVTGWANVGGTWYYMDPATGIMKTGWLNDNGTWYYLEGSGAMKTGWLNDNGTWYYLNGNGSMATGWLNDNGTWYYLNGNGSMAANTYVDGYWLNGSGAWVK